MSAAQAHHVGPNNARLSQRGDLLRLTAIAALVFALLIPCIATSGCSGGTSATEAQRAAPASSTVAPQRSASASTTQLTIAIDDFGFDLLDQSSRSFATTNTVVSPYSVASILALTADGARGATLSQLREALHLQAMSPRSVDAQWARLNSDVAHRNSLQKLEVANAIWGNRGVGLRAEFVRRASEGFDAQVGSVDFAARDMVSVVNDWVSTHTHGMIPKIVDRVDPSTAVILTDAVYFKGLWQDPFRVGGTSDGTFTLADGTEVTVPMMSRWDDSTQSIETSSFTMVRLPYKGSDSAMYVVLPQPRVGLARLQASITAGIFLKSVRTLRRSRPHENTILTLPRLNLTWGQSDMQKPLAALGIRDAFDQATAELTGIADVSPLWIGQFVHKTRITVGERGTEAAAATFDALLGGRPESVSIDRPFLFAIVDEKSDAVLFLGAVGDPRAN